MRMVGLDAEAVFRHPDIAVWRKLPDRENCRLDAELPEGKRVRLHIKRYGAQDAAEPEVEGHRLLEEAGISTAPLVGWGMVPGRGSFVIFDDLMGFTPADKLMEQGTAFEPVLLGPTAELAAKLHSAGLHHRDLYLCHFMARVDGERAELKLIDTARVRRLPGWFARRWVVKDLAQFWYSTLKHGITDSQRREWLSKYSRARGLEADGGFTAAIDRKARSIARHDERLHRKRPERDVSIPTGE
jgi:heptose I phosphotransferase